MGKLRLTEHARLTSTRAGYRRNLGFCPQVRGTAQNPNDHPHGGRTRAIKYPRTP
jgi:large subunit ribosomal protein L2